MISGLVGPTGEKENLDQEDWKEKWDIKEWKKINERRVVVDYQD